MGAISKLKTLEAYKTELTPEQAVAVLTTVSEGSKLKDLDISANDLSSVEPKLLAKAITKLERPEAEMTPQQESAYLAAVNEGGEFSSLSISGIICPCGSVGPCRKWEH